MMRRFTAGIGRGACVHSSLPKEMMLNIPGKGNLTSRYP